MGTHVEVVGVLGLVVVLSLGCVGLKVCLGVKVMVLVFLQLVRVFSV